MKKFQAQAHFGRLPLSVIFCLLFLQIAQASQNRPNPDPKDIFQKLVDSAAAVIYNFAWPTATYKSCELVEVKLVSSGFDIVVKLSGLSGFDGSNLWIVLDFPFRNGDLQRFWVVKHNGNWPPFVTVGAMFKAGQALWKQYAPPPDEAGAVCLMNPTNSTLVFQYRWAMMAPGRKPKSKPVPTAGFGGLTNKPANVSRHHSRSGTMTVSRKGIPNKNIHWSETPQSFR